jgi:HSP20 family molecular chaperone IbpA
MSDFFQSHFEQLQRQLRALAGEFTRVQTVRFSAAPCWSPAINVYRCADRFVVCVDLAGVHKQDLSVQAERRCLRVSGHRLPPEPEVEPRGPMQVLAMEIDYGHFEREVRLPEAIDPERTIAEQHEGWLWIQLPLEAES